MKIAIVGAGAIGGMIAARLASAGQAVSVVARGAHLEAMRAEGGIRLVEHDGRETFGRLRATDRLAELGPQDFVILALKAHQLPAIVDELGVLGEATIVTMQNGIPFWYFQRHGGEFEGRGIESVDPGGRLLRAIPAERILGSIVYPAAEIVRPGVVRHIEGDRFSFGELDGSDSARVRAIAGAMRDAGWKAPVTAHLRHELWLKLWGNLVFNPVSALTRATLDVIARDPLTRELARRVMGEAQAIGEHLGVRFKIGIERRIAGAEAVGAHKTSMLQDVEAGRPLELDALVGAVIELGRMTAVPTPHLDAVYACARLLDRTLRRGSPASSG